MLQLYPSNKTESLAFLLAQIIERHPLDDIFAEDLILIQSQGMGTWLQQELSSHCGISALIRCQMPASFIWALAEDLMPEDKHVPIFEKNNARWEIFRRLPEKLNDPRYASLSTYLEAQINQNHAHDHASVKQKTLFELSVLIADVFDAYQNYRPDWIEAWESGNRLPSDSATDLQQEHAGLKDLEAWQADLWCSLYPDIALDDRRHRSRLFTKLITLLNAPNERVKARLPKRLFIFGLSALPPQWLPVMSALGQHIDIHFLVHNPCEYYWGDVLKPAQKLRLEKALVDKGVSLATAADTFLESNPLLASWGKLGRDYLSLLTDFPDIKESSVSLFDDELNDRLNQDLPISALLCLQNDIQKLQTTQFELSDHDDSIRFASCHSHLREVEALHDYLFHLLNEHPEIKPKDIIVMMPDVQDFASLVDAVFSRPAYDVHGQAHYLPYGISDQLLASDQPLIDSLANLLTLSSSRMTGPDCIDWLEMSAIRSRFDITELELVDIKAWIAQLNIRWGLSESHRDKLLNMTGSGANNTWLSACQRLLAGYIYGQETIYAHQDVECLAFPQRSPEKQLLAGKLMRFLDTIASTIALQTKQLTLQAWLSELSKMWQHWLDFELVSEDVLSLLSRFEKETTLEIAQTNFDEPVSFSVIASLLKTQFDNQRVSQRFLAGRINFCTLMPMRSIPFKSVCMLGLNEGAYPRPVQGQSFDLLTLTPARIGDRSRREDDRYLFLEAICSARSHLYISYCGHDIQDNSERYPSILVTELQSFCAENFILSSRPFEKGETILDHCVVEHHLQAFHPSYYYQVAVGANDQGVHVKNTLSNSLSNTLNNSLHKTLNKTFATEWLPLINSSVDEPSSDLPPSSSHIKHGDTKNVFAQNDDEQFDLFNASTIATQSSIDFDRLVACISHPLRFYYREVLQVNLFSPEEDISVAEPFSMQGLNAYALKKELVQHWFETPSDEEGAQGVFKKWQLAGKLPRAPLDRYYQDIIQTSIEPMYDYLSQRTSGDSSVESVHRTFDLDVGGFKVTGSVMTMGDQLIELALSKNLGASFFSFWLTHVFWSLVCARSHDQQLKHAAKGSYLIGPEKEVWLPLLPADQAEQFAIGCCQLFEQATSEPTAFFPKSTFALLFESESKAKNAFTGNQNIPGECDDLYWQRYCAMSAEVCDPTSLPDLASTELFKQVDCVKELIKITSIETTHQTDTNTLTDSKGQV